MVPFAESTSLSCLEAGIANSRMLPLSYFVSVRRGAVSLVLPICTRVPGGSPDFVDLFLEWAPIVLPELSFGPASACLAHQIAFERIFDAEIESKA